MPDPSVDAADARPLTVGTLAYASGTARRPATSWITLIVAAAVVIRLLYSLTRSADPSALLSLPDQAEYVLTAESFREGNGLAFYDSVYDQKLYAYRMPGYPLMIAALGGIRTVRGVQAVLDGSAVVAVYLLARRLRGETAGLIAAALVAFNPYLIYFSSLLLSETLFTAMVAWGVVGLLSVRSGGRACGIILLLASVYVRPSAIGLGVVAAAVAGAAGPTIGRAILRGGAEAISAAVVLVAMLSPWAARNHEVLGRTVWTTTNAGFTAYDSFNPQADGSSNQAGFRTGRDSTMATSRPLSAWVREKGRGEVGRSEQFSELAWAYARSYPLRDVELAFAKLGRFWSPVPLSADFGGRWLYVVVGGLYAVPLFGLAALGVWRGGLGKKATLILLLPALYFSAVHCVFVGSLRYRVPCDVPLAVLAAAGAVSFARPRAVVAPDEATA